IPRGPRSWPPSKRAPGRSTPSRSPPTAPPSRPVPVTAVSCGGRWACAAGRWPSPTSARSVQCWQLGGVGGADADGGAEVLEGARPLPELTGWNAYVHDVTYDDRGRLAAAGSDE